MRVKIVVILNQFIWYFSKISQSGGLIIKEQLIVNVI